MRQRYRAFLCAAFGTLIAAAVLAGSAFAEPYSRLQVLLPGESAAPGTQSGRIGSPNPQTVGTPFEVTIRACDATWNTVSTIGNMVEIGSSDASASLPPATALVFGEAVVSVTFNAAGSYTISATDQSDPTIPEARSSTVSALALHGFEFSRINQKNQYAGIPMPISVSAVDASGRTVSGFSGPVHLTEMTSFGEGRISPDVVTFSGGTWSGSLTMYRADETSINRGNVNILASLENDPSRNGTSDPFTVHPGVFSKIQIAVPGESPLPGSVSGLTGEPATQSAGHAFSVNVYSTDDYWNPVPSFDVVRIVSSDPEASTPVTGALENGHRSLTLSLGTVGTQTLTVNDQTNNAIDGMTSAGIQVIPSAAQQFVFDTIPSPISAGTPVAVTIHAADQNGNTIPDFSGNAILTANTGPGSISPEAVLFTDGVWSGEILFRGAGGAVSVTCSDYSSPPHTGTSNNIQVLPGPYTGLQVLLPGQIPQGGTDLGYEGAPDDQNAGISFQLTIRAVDAYWNVVPGVNDSIGIVSTDPFANVPARTKLANGQLTIPATLYKTGYQTISAIDIENDQIVSHASSPVRVLSGTYARILIVAPGEEVAPGTTTGRSGTATDQSINFAFTVTVYATDAWWNPVTGVNDVVHLTSTDPMAQLPADAPLQDGQVQMVVRLSTGGFQQLTANNVTQPSMPASATQVRAITSGFHLEAEVYPSTVGAGDPFTLTVKVTNDAGSVIQEVNSFVTLQIQNASSRKPGRGTLLVTQFQLLQGQRSVSETYTFAEPIILIAQDDAGNAPAVTEVITVHPGRPATIHMASEPTWLRGNKHAAVSAQVVDAYENGVPEEAMVFALLAGDGVLTPVDSLTGETGVAGADYLSPRYPEHARIQATSGALSAEIEIETAFVDPKAKGGTVTNYPNPFHPGESPTTIAYVLSDNALVSLDLYTLSGDLVLSKNFPSAGPGGRAGLNEYVWDGRNGNGDWVASGGYILVVTAQGQGETLHVMRRKIGVVR